MKPLRLSRYRWPCQEASVCHRTANLRTCTGFTGNGCAGQRLSGLTLPVTSAMGGDQVDLSLYDPALLVSQVEGNTPCQAPHEGYMKSQQWVPNAPPIAHTQAGVLQNSCQNYSEVSQPNF